MAAGACGQRGCDGTRHGGAPSSGAKGREAGTPLLSTSGFSLPAPNAGNAPALTCVQVGFQCGLEADENF